MDLTRRSFLGASAALGGGMAVSTLIGCAPPPTPPAGTAPFQWGVASGDPDASSVVLWARHQPGGSSVPVNWELASDAAMTNVVASGTLLAEAAHDWCVKVIPGGLSAGTHYWYRFSSDQGTSPIGRTKTARSGSSSRIRVGVASCSNYGFGYFHAYRHLANRTDLDAVFHLGDYIYEHPMLGYGFPPYGVTRPLDPPHEIVSLDDYRRRYAHYRGDKDLQALHQTHPMVSMWDDHEFTNDPFVGGAQNHSPDSEGDWEVRKAVAMQAREEWMPTRVSGTDQFREHDYGSLATFVLVDRQRPFLFPEPGDGDLYLGKAQFEWLDAKLADASAQWFVLMPQSSFGTIASSQSGGGFGNRDRERVFQQFDAGDAGNLVTIGGDLHEFHAFDVPRVPGTYDPNTGAGSAAVEFICGSITSPGGTNDDVGNHVRYLNGTSRGYAVLDITPSALQADFFGFNELFLESPTLAPELWLGGFRTADGANHLTVEASPA